MSKRSICTMCGNEVDGEKGFCGICGGKMNVVDVQDDFGGPAQSFGNIPPVTPVTPVNPLPDNSPFSSPAYNTPPTNYNNGNDPNRTAAIAGMILGIVSVVIGCCIGLGLILGPLGLVFSIKGMKSTTAKGMATAGLVCSIIGLVWGIIWLISFCISGCSAYEITRYYRMFN